LPGAVFSTSASALCVPPLRWGLLARLARRAVSEVLVRSSNWDLSGHCVSSVGRNVPRNLTRPACGFSSPPAARFQVRIYRRGATRAVGTGESCPEVPLARVAASGSRAHQLHPTFLRLPGVISELLARAVLKRRAFTRAGKDHRAQSRADAQRGYGSRSRLSQALDRASAERWQTALQAIWPHLFLLSGHRLSLQDSCEK
jgi:hypothetical protein